MPTIVKARHLLAAYADKEPWRRAHDEAKSCVYVERQLAWGLHLYRGLLDLEARAMTEAAEPEAPSAIEMMPPLYRAWIEASESLVDRAREIARLGFDVDGLGSFEAAMEEARCLAENLALEGAIRPIEELRARAMPGNPRPGRYGD